MTRFLLLKLAGPMQAWGQHTLETFRPVHQFPTRSGLVGLLGACLGLDGQQRAELCALDASFRLAVRADQDPNRPYGASIITDFHTVSPVRRADGQLSPYPLVTRREYLCDASFTAALAFLPDGRFRHEEVVAAVNNPRHTPYLGRRSCPLGRPLLEGEVRAESLAAALAQVPPYAGVIYSEDPEGHHQQMRVRDVILPGRNRHFGTRQVYIRTEQGADMTS